MCKEKEEKDDMTPITLEELEFEIKMNNEKYSDTITNFIDSLKKKDLKTGRGRPKDPVEAEILSNFKRKK